MIGRLYIEDRATGKTLDTSGSSKIGIQLGSRTWSTSGSQIKIGFQGVDAAGGTPARPDGSYSGVSLTLDQGTDTINANSWNSWTPDAGTSTFSNGDLVALVVEFVTRNGADSIAVQTIQPPSVSQFPVVNNYTGTWLTTGNSGHAPAVVFTFSDGTLGFFDGCAGSGLTSAVTWDDGDNPDEYGAIFQVPFDCEIDEICVPVRLASNAAAFDLYLSSSPTSGRTNILGPLSYSAKSLQIVNSEATMYVPLATPQALTSNTDYCVSLKATSTGSDDVRITRMTLGDAAHRILVSPAGNTLNGASANAGGNFTASSTVFPPFCVRISKISGFGSGGGLLTHPGMSGGMRG